MINLYCSCEKIDCEHWVHISETEYWNIREKCGKNVHFESNLCQPDPDTVVIETHENYRVAVEK